MPRPAEDDANYQRHAPSSARAVLANRNLAERGRAGPLPAPAAQALVVLGYPDIKHLLAFLGRGPLRARDVLVQRLAGTGAAVEPTAGQQTAMAAACAMIAR